MGGICAPTFFGHMKFEVKNFLKFFHLQSTVDSEFFKRGFGHQLFLVMLTLMATNFQNFVIYRVLWTLNFSEGISGYQFFWSL